MRYLLIPSCEVFPVDSLEGTTTLKRLCAGLAEWKTANYDRVVVCGGVYLPSEVQTRPSGAIMKEWLIEHGIEEMCIITEVASRDTYENISGVLELMVADAEPKITVITHWQHALRFWVTFCRAHGIGVKVLPLWYWVDIKTFFLEWPMLLVHVFDKNGTGRIASNNRNQRTY